MRLIRIRYGAYRSIFGTNDELQKKTRLSYDIILIRSVSMYLEEGQLFEKRLDNGQVKYNDEVKLGMDLCPSDVPADWSV